MLSIVCHYLRYYIALEGLLAIAQALWSQIFRVSFLAAVDHSYFVSPNLFGATMATCALLFSLVRHGKWVAISYF